MDERNRLIKSNNILIAEIDLTRTRDQEHRLQRHFSVFYVHGADCRDAIGMFYFFFYSHLLFCFSFYLNVCLSRGVRECVDVFI